MDHIDAMDELKGLVGLNSYAQRSPISEYRITGAEMFEEMVDDIRENTARMLLSVVPSAQPMQRVQVAQPTAAGFAGAKTAVKRPAAPIQKTVKAGRNDPCPCGSGKKFKNCCGAE
jgi:preprotein translocase subunit SecA